MLYLMKVIVIHKESFQGAKELRRWAEDSYRLQSKDLPPHRLQDCSVLMQMMPWPLDSLNIQFLMCWLFQMAPSARKALDNQLFAQTLQWEMAERKAYKQHR
ncbi:hypothetical protein H8959_016986 [Pygathrix nigripes]